MNVLYKAGLGFLLAVVLAACGGAPVKQRADTATAVAVEKSGGTCVLPYRPVDRYETKPDPVSLVPVFRECRALQPLIEWAKGASRHETYRGGCDVEHGYIRCSSETPLRGVSADRKEGRISGEGPLLLAGAVGRLDGCAGYPSIRRELRLSVEWDRGDVPRMRYEAEYQCYR